MRPAPPPPAFVVLDHDDDAAAYVGHTRDGRQFFFTTPFLPGEREFLALYLFDEKGNLLEATIDDLGPRVAVDWDSLEARRDELLASLGELTFGTIVVVPFKTERFGVEFGFILRPPDEECEDWWVLVEPGNYMAFHPPFTSGDYDT